MNELLKYLLDAESDLRIAHECCDDLGYDDKSTELKVLRNKVRAMISDGAREFAEPLE